jgi:hypothetical protein
MAINKTSEFVDMTVFANKQISVNIRYTLDDPDDNELPVSIQKVYVLVEGDDISGFPEAIQEIINSSWSAL